MTSVQDEVAESKKANGDFLIRRDSGGFFFVAACTGVKCDEGTFLLSASAVEAPIALDLQIFSSRHNILTIYTI